MPSFHAVGLGTSGGAAAPSPKLLDGLRSDGANAGSDSVFAMSASGPGCVKTLLRIRWISFAAQDAYIAFSADQCRHRDVAIGSAIRSEGWRKELAAVAGSEARSHSHGDRLHQWCDPHDSHHPLKVVREHVQTHLSTDVLKRACQEVRVTHP